ncbi:hypothetical protein WICPIJ_009694 [Wickerhamomyces pijperi]|uniref:Uncharacterized protein n=1 Tax=Wickerhamomyces pijperi TaxID=599730 RepID=A0A9P8PKC8_WICPI|nr:hypothetical protein WICPIJ_009694 [Wickerhamomyces pijperi]
MYPAVVPNSLDTECFSINSEQSILIMAFWSLNKNSATFLANSVLPEPDNPKNKKEAGWCGLANPDLDNLMALETALTASPCPTTAWDSSFSMEINLEFSDWVNLETGIPVNLAAVSAMVSLSTTFWIKEPLPALASSAATWDSKASILSLISGMAKQVTLSQLSSRDQGRVQDSNTVVDLILWLQPSQDSNGFSGGWFSDVDFLESSFKSTILLNNLSVLRVGGGTNHLQVTSGQGWLQDVGGIVLTVTHQHVDFIDE